MKNKKFALICMTLLILLPIALSYGLGKYYARYEQMQKQLEISLEYDSDTANAIKHATAASDMFHALRIVLGDNAAEKAVIQLGVLNEYIEQIKYPNDRDSAREIMKDLHNNYAGIEAAKLADDEDALPVILTFADNRTLIVNQAYNPFFEDKEPKQDVVAFGYNWFKSHYAEIDKRIQKKVMRAKDLRSLAQIELSNLPWQSATIE